MDEPTKNKGGRPRQGAEVKRAPISMKTSPELRRRIEEAAEGSGLSMAQEIERRLLESFTLEDELGGRDNLAFFRASASIIKSMEHRTGKGWRDDTATWQAIRKLLDRLLAQWRPVPPGVEKIGPAVSALRIAERRLAEASAIYEAKWPKPGPEEAAEAYPSVLVALMEAGRRGVRYLLPADGLPENRAEMEADFAPVHDALEAMVTAQRGMDAAFAANDAAVKEGKALANSILDSLDLALERDDDRYGN